MNFPDGQHPNFLVAENSKLYYIVNNSVYSMATNATALPTKADYITGADKTYYLIWVNADFNKQPTTVTGTGDALPTFLGLHGSGNGENYLRAMKIQ